MPGCELVLAFVGVLLISTAVCAIELEGPVAEWNFDKGRGEVAHDARGALVSHDFITTVDSAGVRTELGFRENESAVIEPIPVSLETVAPVNLRVLQYDGAAVRLLLNGNTDATLKVFVGSKYFRGRDAYRVTCAKVTTTIVEEDGTLSVPLHLDGQV